MGAVYLKGPIGFLVISKEGADMDDPMMLVKGYLLDVVYAMVAAMLLCCACCGSNLGYGKRVLFVAGLGLFTGISTHLNVWHWMAFPLDYTIVMVADSVIAWLLGGMVMAAMIKPAATTSP